MELTPEQTKSVNEGDDVENPKCQRGKVKCLLSRAVANDPVGNFLKGPADKTCRGRVGSDCSS